MLSTPNNFRFSVVESPGIRGSSYQGEFFGERSRKSCSEQQTSHFELNKSTQLHRLFRCQISEYPSEKHKTVSALIQLIHTNKPKKNVIPHSASTHIMLLNFSPHQSFKYNYHMYPFPHLSWRRTKTNACLSLYDRCSHSFHVLVLLW